MSSSNPVGTIAFILDEEALLVRVNKGWQYIAVSFTLLGNVIKFLMHFSCYTAWNLVASGYATYDDNVCVSIVWSGLTSIQFIKQQQHFESAWQLHGELAW